MRKTTPLFFCATCLVGFFLCSCSNPQKAAKGELKQREYRFTSDDFLRAAGKGDIEAVVLFGRAGMKVDALDARKRTALMEAAKAGKLDSTKLLLNAGANPHLKDLYARDSLMEAAAVGQVEIVDLLLGQGVSPTARDDAGWTALSLGAYHSHDDVVNTLVTRATQRQLGEALLLSAASGNVRSADYVIKRGASVESRSVQHLTPLMVAADKGHPDMVQYLLTQRADTSARGKVGVTALSLAKENRHDEVVKILERNEALRKATVISGKTLSPEEIAKRDLVALNGSTIRSEFTTTTKKVMDAFKIHDYQERSLPVALSSVESDHAMMRRLGANDALEMKISIGQIIPGTKYRLEEVQPKEVQNRVLISHIETGARHLLNKDRLLEVKDKTVVLISPQSRYRFVAKSGDIFKTVSKQNVERQYQVVGLSSSSLTLRDVAGKELFEIR